MLCMKAITLVETRSGCAIAEREPRYDVMLKGVKVGQLYYNTRGYTGCNLPLPDGKRLALPEMSISAIRKEVAKLNKEWAAAS